MKVLGLGFTNSVGTRGVLDVCLCFDCGGVGGGRLDPKGFDTICTSVCDRCRLCRLEPHSSSFVSSNCILPFVYTFSDIFVEL